MWRERGVMVSRVETDTKSTTVNPQPHPVHGARQVFPYVGYNARSVSICRLQPLGLFPYVRYNARSAKRQAAPLPQQGHEAVHMCIVSLNALLLIMGEWGGGGVARGCFFRIYFSCRVQQKHR